MIEWRKQQVRLLQYFLVKSKSFVGTEKPPQKLMLKLKKGQLLSESLGCGCSLQQGLISAESLLKKTDFDVPTGGD